MSKLPITVLMITKNESYHIADSIKNLSDFASEILIVDSYSTDNTVDLALSLGAKVIQRKFINFGEQWGFTVNSEEISYPWSMKLDPDERLSVNTKNEIKRVIEEDLYDGFYLRWRLWFMGKDLRIKSKPLLRLWKTGKCNFSNKIVNEQPVVNGKCRNLNGFIDHLDCSNLHQWYSKQNLYSTLEAKSMFLNNKNDFKNHDYRFSFSKRNLLLKIYKFMPFKNFFLFLYLLFIVGAIKSGKIGIIWASLRVEVYKMRNYKYIEMKFNNQPYSPPNEPLGKPNNNAIQTK